MAAKMVNGDVVKLKSDGPWMTVTKDKPEEGNKHVQVSWFDGSQLEQKVLPKDALELHPSCVKQDAAKAE